MEKRKEKKKEEISLDQKRDRSGLPASVCVHAAQSAINRERG